MTNESRKAPSQIRRGVVGASLVTGGFLLGVATRAAVAAPEGGPFGGGFRHHGPQIGMVQFMTRHALENVGATSAQETRIHDIIADTFTKVQGDDASRDATRKAAMELLKAPTVDAAAVEKLRAQKIAEMDAKSKLIADAIVKASAELTPAQRASLVQNAQDRMEHGGWGGGWRHHDRMEPHGPDGGDKD